MWEFWVKIIGGHNQDCSPGDSTPESSEKLLQRWGVGVEFSVSVIFGEVGIHATRHIFFQEISAGFVKPLLVMRISCCHERFWCFFRYEEIQELGSYIWSGEHLTIWRPVLTIFPVCLISALHPDLPSGGGGEGFEGQQHLISCL